MRVCAVTLNLTAEMVEIQHASAYPLGNPNGSRAMTEFPAYKNQPIAKLIPYARNSRTHSDEQISQIAASIKEFGFLNPIITDGNNGIVAGHGRVLAAQKLGMDELPCVEASHLTEAQRRAYIIADNKLALNAGWDDNMLRVELDELGDMGFSLDITGFDIDEIPGIESDDDTIGVADDKILNYLESPIKTLSISISADDYDRFYDIAERYQTSAELSSISEAIIEMVMGYDSKI